MLHLWSFQVQILLRETFHRDVDSMQKPAGSFWWCTECIILKSCDFPFTYTILLVKSLNFFKHYVLRKLWVWYCFERQRNASIVYCLCKYTLLLDQNNELIISQNKLRQFLFLKLLRYSLKKQISTHTPLTSNTSPQVNIKRVICNRTLQQA